MVEHVEGCMTNCFHKLDLLKGKLDMAVHEGKHAYHTVIHSHSLRSMGCTTSLHKKFAYKKFPVEEQKAT
jgi:hypothetical protein